MDHHSELFLAQANFQPWRFLPVHPALLPIVETIMLMEVEDFSLFKINNVNHYPWTARTNLFFTISDDPVSVKNKNEVDFVKYPDNFILGPRLLEDTIRFSNHHRVLAVSFKAGGLQKLCGFPISSIINKCLDAELVFGKEIEEISTGLKEAENHIEIHQIIENYLLKKILHLKVVTPFDLAIAELIYFNGNMSIDKLSHLACLSNRQLERKCLDGLGLSPKLFARLTRFSKAYMIKEIQPQTSWTSIAHHCGYFDQMHLIRDFKQFAGHSPSIIEKMISNSINAVTALQGNG